MSQSHYVCSLRDVAKMHPGGKKCFENVHLSFIYGAKIGVVGVNGSGKTSLLRIISGEDKDFSGELWISPSAKIGYLPQEPVLDPTRNVRENITLGVSEKKKLLDEFTAISMQLGENYTDELLERMTVLQDQIDSQNLWDIDSQIDIAIEALRCPPDDASVESLSGGEKRRVALCKLLLEQPDILLLDEPTNHLDAETTAWLQKYLQSYKGTVLLVTHDRYFLDKVTGWILELDRGQTIPNEGNYSSWIEQKAKRLALEERVEEAKKRTLARELEWVQQSPKARRTKSRARLRAYDELVSRAENDKIGKAQIIIPNGQRLGSKVLEVTNLKKVFGDTVLFENLSFSLPPGGIVGVIGPNGAGKTTLFRIITGDETPDEGNIDLGETVSIGCVDQSRDDLTAMKTVWEEISDGLDVLKLGNAEMNSRSYCAAFNFKGSDQQKKMGNLSGGERNRVHMAKLLRQGHNLILLDEPTNDLDVETLRALEDAILDFPGCVIVISHDRWFLDRICTHILSFDEDDSQVLWFQGNFEEYEADKKRRLGEDAATPKRIKHRKFSRI
jgi:ATP-binding cassette ChvD family protein